MKLENVGKMTPAALNKKDAREFLGCTERVFQRLIAAGTLRPHPLFGSFVVKDLEDLLYGNIGERRQIPSETENPGREEVSRLRLERTGSGRTRGSKVKGLLDSAIESNGFTNIA
jgi:hypothetical protein